MEYLEGRNVKLRPIVKEDLVFLNKWKNDERVYRYLGGGFLPISIDIQNNWMSDLMDTTGRNKRFIIENSEGVPAGMVGLYSINWISRNCELGIFIGELQEQGNGYGYEACRTIERFAAEYLNLRKIKVYVVKKNETAVQMYEQLGFKTAGELQEERFIEGIYHSVLLMEKMIQVELPLNGGGYRTNFLLRNFRSADPVKMHLMESA